MVAIAKIVKLSRKAQITLPKVARQALGIEPGDRLEVTVQEGQVVLTSVEQSALRSRGLLRGTWGANRAQVEDYLRGERSSWERNPHDS